MNKKKIIYGSVIVIGIIFITLGLIAVKKSMRTFFIINGKQKNTVQETLNYGEKLALKPQSFDLKAMQGDKDITKEITYQTIKLEQLKTYKIVYKVNDQKFIRKIKVVDKKNPIIQGIKEVELYQGDVFDQGVLSLTASDNYDGDLTDKIEIKQSVDTFQIGTQTIEFQVKDSSKNKAKFLVKIHILEKKKEQVPIQSSEKVVTNPNDMKVLVNKQNILPDGWAPNDLVNVQGYQLRSEAANAWNAMMAAAASEGITVNIVSAYRTQSYQKKLYDRYYAQDPVNAPFYSALPRRSEHELGLAIDVSYGDGQLHWDLEQSSTGIWLAKHAHEFGWILRYPQNKTDITQYVYEAWHYRYVGVNLATTLQSKNITLEEYYQ